MKKEEDELTAKVPSCLFDEDNYEKLVYIRINKNYPVHLPFGVESYGGTYCLLGDDAVRGSICTCSSDLPHIKLVSLAFALALQLRRLRHHNYSLSAHSDYENLKRT
jgi:hypothetical protein